MGMGVGPVPTPESPFLERENQGYAVALPEGPGFLPQQNEGIQRIPPMPRPSRTDFVARGVGACP